VVGKLSHRLRHRRLHRAEYMGRPFAVVNVSKVSCTPLDVGSWGSIRGLAAQADEYPGGMVGVYVDSMYILQGADL
jgi:hypothetical protein